MEGRGAVCTRRTGAVALRGSERAKGGREQREWGSNCAHKVLGLLANSQTYTLGSIPLPPMSTPFFFSTRDGSLFDQQKSGISKLIFSLFDGKSTREIRFSDFSLLRVCASIFFFNRLPMGFGILYRF